MLEKLAYLFTKCRIIYPKISGGGVYDPASLLIYVQISNDNEHYEPTSYVKVPPQEVG